MKETIKKIIKVKTLMLGIIVNSALAFFCYKFYDQGELVFLRNQYSIFLAFVAVNFWMFLYLLYQNGELKKDNIIIKDLLANLFDGQSQIAKDNIKLHRNTQKVLIDYMQMNTESKKSEEVANDKCETAIQ